MRKAALGTDIGLTILLQAVAALLAFAVQIAVKRFIGDAGFDVYALVMFTYVVLGAAVADSGIVAMAFPRVAAEGGEESVSLPVAFKLRLLTFVAGSLFATGVAAALGDVQLLPLVLSGMAVAFVSGRFATIRQVPEMIWRLKGRTWIIATIVIVDAALMLCMLFLADQHFDLDVQTVLLIQLGVNVPGFFLILVPIWRLVRRQDTKHVRPGRRYYKLFFRGAIPIGTMTLAAQLFGRIEPIIISVTLGVGFVGEYVAAVTPLMGGLFVATTIGTGLQPLLAQIQKRTRSDLDGAWVVSIGMRTLGTIALIAATGALLFADNIMVLYGQDYVEYSWILRVFSITLGLEFMVVLLDSTLVGVGKRKEVMYGTFLSLALALAFQLSLIPFWGIAGLLVGKILALVGKIVYQQRVIGPEFRQQVAVSLLLVAGAGVTLAAAYMAGRTFEMEYQAVLLTLATVIALKTFRLVDLDGLRILRSVSLGARR